MKKKIMKREMGGSERHYGGGWNGTEFNIGFEGSQALPDLINFNFMALGGMPSSGI
jgi:hypothetical protein